MNNLMKKDKETCDNSVVMMNKIIKKVETYTTKRNELPADADGIYLIVEGKAKVVNKLYNYNYAGKKLNKNDFIGDSKFIKSQGFSYFGDIIACKDEPKIEDK